MSESKYLFCIIPDSMEERHSKKTCLCAVIQQKTAPLVPPPMQWMPNLASVAAISLFRHSCLSNQMHMFQNEQIKNNFFCVYEQPIRPSNNNLNMACYCLLLWKGKMLWEGNKNVDHLLVKKHRDTIPNELKPTLLLIVITPHVFGSNMARQVCSVLYN